MVISKQTVFQYIVIFVLILALLLKCGDGVRGHLGETTIDTLKITHIDTTWFDSVRVRTITQIEKVQIFEYPEDSSKVYRFTTSVEDSLISGNIITGVKLKDSTLTLLSQYIDYTPLFPKYIHRVDSIIITKETWLEEPSRIRLAVGLNSVFSENFYGVGPSVELLIKEKVNVNAGYDIVNKGVTFGVHIPLTLRK